MLTKKQKENIKNWVEEAIREMPEEAISVNVGSKKIKLYVYLKRMESPQGTIEPPWSPNIEGLEIHAESILGESDEGTLLEAHEYALSLVNITHHTVVDRDVFGGKVEVATLDNCSSKEFDIAVEKLAPYLWGYGNTGGPEELPKKIF